MLYEVSTSSGYTAVINADSSGEAKKEVCRQRGYKPYGNWTGIRSMTAERIKVDFPETIYRGLTDEKMQELEGRDLVIYD